MKRTQNKKCDWCDEPLPKGRRRFCCNTCKDKFHNDTNPRGKYDHLNPNDMDEWDPGDDVYWSGKTDEK